MYSVMLPIAIVSELTTSTALEFLLSCMTYGAASLLEKAS